MIRFSFSIYLYMNYGYNMCENITRQIARANNYVCCLNVKSEK